MIIILHAWRHTLTIPMSVTSVSFEAVGKCEIAIAPSRKDSRSSVVQFTSPSTHHWSEYHPCVIHTFSLQKCESPRHPFRIFKSCFLQAPELIIYDNACRLHIWIWMINVIQFWMLLTTVSSKSGWSMSSDFGCKCLLSKIGWSTSSNFGCLFRHSASL